MNWILLQFVELANIDSAMYFQAVYFMCSLVCWLQQLHYRFKHL